MVQNAIRKLDKIDRKILQLLQKDGRISNVKLADMIHLSPTPCLEREEAGKRRLY